MLKRLIAPALVIAIYFTGSCAHVGPVVDEFTDCAEPHVKDGVAKAWPAAVAILSCAESSPLALPACAEAGLFAFGASLGPNGMAIVDCLVDAILHGFETEQRSLTPQENLVQKRAKAWQAKRAAAGVKLRSAAP